MPRHPDTAGSVEKIQGSVFSSVAGVLADYPGELFRFQVGDTWMEPPEGCRMEDLTVAGHPGMHRYAPTRGLPGLVSAVAERVTGRSGGACPGWYPPSRNVSPDAAACPQVRRRS